MACLTLWCVYSGLWHAIYFLEILVPVYRRRTADCCTKSSTDIVRTSYGRRTDVARTSHGRRTDVARTSHGRRTDVARTSHGRRTDVARTSHGRRTDVARTSHGRRTDVARTSHGRRTDVARTSHGRRTDVARTSYGRRTDVVRTSYGRRTDVVRTSCSHEGDDRLVHVVVGWRHVDKHQRLCVPPERVLHQHCQLVVAVRDEVLFAGERGDHVSERRQRLVDRHCFL